MLSVLVFKVNDSFDDEFGNHDGSQVDINVTSHYFFSYSNKKILSSFESNYSCVSNRHPFEFVVSSSDVDSMEEMEVMEGSVVSLDFPQYLMNELVVLIARNNYGNGEENGKGNNDLYCTKYEDQRNSS